MFRISRMWHAVTSNTYFKAASSFINHIPLRKVGICSVGLVGSFAILDSQRAIDVDECGGFVQEHSAHLEQSLEQIHSIAFDGNLRYNEMVHYRHKTIELYYLYTVAADKYADVIAMPGLAHHERSELATTVARNNQLLAVAMCRQSMIRNGHVVNWLSAVVDEVLRCCMAPVRSFCMVPRRVKERR